MHHTHALQSPRLASFLVLVIIGMTGCLQSPQEAAEHHTPAHKPATFPAAVDRLLVLHEEVVDGDTSGAELDPLSESTDLVRWLPELAADSDLAEEPWNRVAATAQGYRDVLLVVMQQSTESRATAYAAQRHRIEELQAELVELKAIYALVHDGPQAIAQE